LVVDPAMIQLRIEPQNRDGAVVEALPQLRSLAGRFKLDDFARHAHRTEKFVDVLHISPIMLMLGMANPIGSPVESRPRFMKRKRDRFHARRSVPSCPTADRGASIVLRQRRTAAAKSAGRRRSDYRIQCAQINESGNIVILSDPMSSSTACLTPAWPCPGLL